MQLQSRKMLLQSQKNCKNTCEQIADIWFLIAGPKIVALMQSVSPQLESLWSRDFGKTG